MDGSLLFRSQAVRIYDETSPQNTGGGVQISGPYSGWPFNNERIWKDGFRDIETHRSCFFAVVPTTNTWHFDWKQVWSWFRRASIAREEALFVPESPWATLDWVSWGLRPMVPPSLQFSAQGSLTSLHSFRLVCFWLGPLGAFYPNALSAQGTPIFLRKKIESRNLSRTGSCAVPDCLAILLVGCYMVSSVIANHPKFMGRVPTATGRLWNVSQGYRGPWP